MVTKNPALKAMSEREWQAAVIAHARQAGFMVYYIPDAMWRRAFASGIPQALGDRGFPDLVLVGQGRLCLRELKKEGGRLSEHQIVWRDALLSAGVDWAVWYPSDLDDVVIPDLYGGVTK